MVLLGIAFRTYGWDVFDVQVLAKGDARWRDESNNRHFSASIGLHSFRLLMRRVAFTL